MVNDLLENPPLMHLIAFMKLLFGILLVLFHNFWGPNWSVIITLLGWIAVLKATFFFLFPRVAIETGKKMIYNPKIITFTGIACLVLGLYLSLTGFPELRAFLNL